MVKNVKKIYLVVFEMSGTEEMLLNTEYSNEG